MNRLIILLVIFFILFLTACEEQETYKSRITQCIENGQTTEFDIVGTDEKGFSHNIKPSCLLGAPIPEFESVSLRERNINSGDMLGEINVINFWFLKCAPCIAEMPNLNLLVEKYNSDVVNFIAITKDSKDAIVPFLKKEPFNFTILHESKSLIVEEFKLLWGYPFTIITDKENKIVKLIQASSNNKNSLYSEISSTIDSLLNKHH